MRYLLAACLAACPLFCSADLVMQNKDADRELRLYDRPCNHAETLAKIKEEWRPKFRDAKIRQLNGTILFYGCWIEESGIAYIIFEDGDKLAFPLSGFKDPSV